MRPWRDGQGDRMAWENLVCDEGVNWKKAEVLAIMGVNSLGTKGKLWGDFKKGAEVELPSLPGSWDLIPQKKWLYLHTLPKRGGNRHAFVDPASCPFEIYSFPSSLKRILNLLGTSIAQIKQIISKAPLELPAMQHRSN